MSLVPPDSVLTPVVCAWAGRVTASTTGVVHADGSFATVTAPPPIVNALIRLLLFVFKTLLLDFSAVQGVDNNFGPEPRTRGHSTRSGRHCPERALDQSESKSRFESN